MMTSVQAMKPALKTIVKTPVTLTHAVETLFARHQIIFQCADALKTGEEIHTKNVLNVSSRRLQILGACLLKK